MRVGMQVSKYHDIALKAYLVTIDQASESAKLCFLKGPVLSPKVYCMG